MVRDTKLFQPGGDSRTGHIGQFGLAVGGYFAVTVKIAKVHETSPEIKNRYGQKKLP